MLDPDYPVHPALHRFLLAMERAYPVGPHIPSGPIPKLPERRPWVGDRKALFGGDVPTAILASIGVRGWTFEALCVPLATGHDRVVVKKSLRRLEEEGVLQGDRERKPGFKVRAVRIADDFPARQELLELLQGCAKAWPDIGRAVETAFEQLEPRTKEHLRRRGLIPCDCHPKGGHPPSMTYAEVANRHRRAEARRERAREPKSGADHVAQQGHIVL